MGPSSKRRGRHRLDQYIFIEAFKQASKLPDDPGTHDLTALAAIAPAWRLRP